MWDINLHRSSKNMFVVESYFTKCSAVIFFFLNITSKYDSVRSTLQVFPITSNLHSKNFLFKASKCSAVSKYYSLLTFRVQSYFSNIHILQL